MPTAPGRDEEYAGPALKIPGAVASESGPDEDEDQESDDEATTPTGDVRAETRPDETEGEAEADRVEDA